MSTPNVFFLRRAGVACVMIAAIGAFAAAWTYAGLRNCAVETPRIRTAPFLVRCSVPFSIITPGANAERISPFAWSLRNAAAGDVIAVRAASLGLETTIPITNEIVPARILFAEQPLGGAPTLLKAMENDGTVGTLFSLRDATEISYDGNGAFYFIRKKPDAYDASGSVWHYELATGTESLFLPQPRGKAITAFYPSHDGDTYAWEEKLILKDERGAISGLGSATVKIAAAARPTYDLRALSKNENALFSKVAFNEDGTKALSLELSSGTLYEFNLDDGTAAKLRSPDGSAFVSYQYEKNGAASFITERQADAGTQFAASCGNSEWKADRTTVSNGPSSVTVPGLIRALATDESCAAIALASDRKEQKDLLYAIKDEKAAELYSAADAAITLFGSY